MVTTKSMPFLDIFIVRTSIWRFLSKDDLDQSGYPWGIMQKQSKNTFVLFRSFIQEFGKFICRFLHWFGVFFPFCFDSFSPFLTGLFGLRRVLVSSKVDKTSGRWPGIASPVTKLLIFIFHTNAGIDKGRERDPEFVLQIIKYLKLGLKVTCFIKGCTVD